LLVVSVRSGLGAAWVMVAGTGAIEATVGGAGGGGGRGRSKTGAEVIPDTNAFVPGGI
jgi:hypothetical protein